MCAAQSRLLTAIILCAQTMTMELQNLLCVSTCIRVLYVCVCMPALVCDCLRVWVKFRNNLFYVAQTPPRDLKLSLGDIQVIKLKPQSISRSASVETVSSWANRQTFIDNETFFIENYIFKTKNHQFSSQLFESSVQPPPADLLQECLHCAVINEVTLNKSQSSFHSL
jgi:hypothetical protein